MTHLILKQTTNSTEQVNSTCIDDLYKLTISTALDSQSDVAGKINTESSTAKKINALHTLNESNEPVVSGNTGRWDNLFATATTYAIEFEDSAVEAAFKTILRNKGYSEDTTSTNLAKITRLNGNDLTDKSSYNTLNDLQYLTGCTYFDWNVVYDCANITSVKLPPNLTNIPNIEKCPKLIAFRIPSNVTGAFRSRECTSLNLVVVDGQLSSLTFTENGGKFSAPADVVIRGSVDSFSQQDPSTWKASTVVNIWVSDVDTYAAKSGFSDYISRLKPIAEMPASLVERVNEL